MNNSKIQFGAFELTCILVNSICAKIYLGYPRVMCEAGGTAGWILALYSSILAGGVFYIILLLYKKYFPLCIVDLLKKAFGETFSKVFFLVIIGFISLLLAMILRLFAEDVKTICLPNIPVENLILFFLIGGVIGAYFGIECIVRLHAVFLPVVAFSYFLILIPLIPHIEITKTLPLFGFGIKEVFIYGAKNISQLAEIMLLFVLVPYIKKYDSIKKAGKYAVILSGFLMTIGTFVYATTFQYPVSTEFYIPMYQMARTVTLGKLVARIESVFVLFWVIVAILFISIGVFYITMMTQKGFNLEHRKPLVYPYAIIIYCISLLPKSMYSASDIEGIYIRNIIWIFAFLIPIVLLIILHVKDRNKKRLKEKKNEG